MRTMILIGALSALSGGAASAATFWPASGPAVSRRQLQSLTGTGKVRLVGDRVVIDDMMFPRENLLLSGFTAKRWPDGRLVYDASGLAADGQKAVADACALWAAASTIQCVKRTTETGGYLQIMKIAGTVSSTDVGYPGSGRASKMNLCCFANTLHIAHELGHSLGLSHEQARSDRDSFVRIETANIKAGHAAQFDKRNSDNYGDYDFRSVMHYRQDAFSANGKPTIVVLPPNEALQSLIGRATQLSTIDGEGMTSRYPKP